MQTSQTTGQRITSRGLRATWQLTANHRLKTYKEHDSKLHKQEANKHFDIAFAL